MKNKYGAFLFIAVLAVAAILLKQCGKATADKPAGNSVKTSSVDHKGRGLNRNVNILYYSKHAKCRMECRHISQAEVERVLQEGKVNYRKSDLNSTDGPEYAVEDVTDDGQKVRIIFAPKKTQTTVVTVIDLGNDWDCPSCN